MTLQSFHDAASMEAAAGEWLALDERRNNVMLGILRGREHGEFHGWLLLDGNKPKLAMLRTPPFPLNLAGSDADAARTAAETLAGPFDIVHGPSEIAGAFTF